MINIKHPAAKMLVKLAEAQNKEIGDGATSSVVLTGEFLKNAQELMDQGIHPTTIVKGFVMAYTKALEFLEKIAFDVHDKNLKSIAMTMLQGKVEEEDAEHLAEITVEAIKIAGKKENIKIEYRPGGKIKDTKLIKGMMIDLGKRVHPSMPKKVKNAKILLIDREFDVRKLENAKIEMNDPMRMKAFMDYKKKVLEVAVNMIARCGANVVLCEKNIAEVAMSYLAMKGILGVRDVPKDVLVLLQKSTGAKIVSNINDVSPSVLGYAGLVEETKIGMEEIMYITECKDPKSAGILIRGGTENVTMEIKRRLESLIGVLSSMINEKKAVAGGGATELEISMRLKEYARKVEGKEQLAIDAYASALEAIPKSLIINAGRNPIDLVPKIKSEHENGRPEIGFRCPRRKNKKCV
jgi:chaperonin GroEL (HSP60 family)